MTPTKKQLARLPVWAQDHIGELERQRGKAVRVLEEYRDTQTPSKIWTDDLVSLGEDEKGPSYIRNYLQVERIEMEHAGVHLDVNLHHDEGIKLSWRPVGRAITMGDICFIPEAYQQARLVNLVYNEPSLRQLLRGKAREHEQETS